MTTRLDEALRSLDGAVVHGSLRSGPLRLQRHAGRVEPGDVFVAIAGTRTDGHDYVDEAARRGAAAVVVERLPEHGLPCAAVVVPDTRVAWSRLAALRFGNPSHHLFVAGIGGTNGKTTVAWMLRFVLQRAGMPAAVLSTAGWHGPGVEGGAGLTTPDAHDLHAALRTVHEAGGKAVAIETSSHGLAQRRVDDVAFDVGVFTGLGRDHLDYHRDLAAYEAAKRRMFDEILPRSPKSAQAVLRADEAGARIARRCPVPTVTFGTPADASPQWRVELLGEDLRGQRARATGPGGTIEFELAVPGDFNALNAFAAALAAAPAGVDLHDALATLASFEGVPGRMQRVGYTAQRAAVFVDYAHTPDALEAALRALRRAGARRTWLVFGCGGERDPGKRPLMARVAQRWADGAVVTSDNPRGEDPLAIVRDIERGFDATSWRRRPRLDGDGWTVELDRRAAIAHALDRAAAGDAVLVAGKGHERGQQIGQKVLPFDDVEVVRALLDEETG